MVCVCGYISVNDTLEVLPQRLRSQNRWRVHHAGSKLPVFGDRVTTDPGGRDWPTDIDAPTRSKTQDEQAGSLVQVGLGRDRASRVESGRVSACNSLRLFISRGNDCFSGTVPDIGPDLVNLFPGEVFEGWHAALEPLAVMDNAPHHIRIKRSASPSLSSFLMTLGRALSSASLEQAPDGEELRTLTRDRLRSSRVPERIVILESLAYNESGKGSPSKPTKLSKLSEAAMPLAFMSPTRACTSPRAYSFLSQPSVDARFPTRPP